MIYPQYDEAADQPGAPARGVIEVCSSSALLGIRTAPVGSLDTPEGRVAIMEKMLWEKPRVRELPVAELESMAELDVAFAVITLCTDFN
ncbi:hypothetical protein [Nocardia suismassiliense]|nr:hypothetical protein [Nocardia suismassiliense]